MTAVEMAAVEMARVMEPADRSLFLDLWFLTESNRSDASKHWYLSCRSVMEEPSPSNSSFREALDSEGGRWSSLAPSRKALLGGQARVDSGSVRGISLRLRKPSASSY
jgi:hypothetical protein